MPHNTSTVVIHLHLLIAILLFPTIVAGSTLQIPTDYPDIFSAITAADPNDIIRLDPNFGPYSGSYNIDITIDKPLTIQSGSETQTVTINCNGSEDENHQAFKVVNAGQGTVFENLTIINGYDVFGGAIECIDTSVTIDNCHFTMNTSIIKGGAISLNNSFAEIIDTTIKYNASLMTFPQVGGGGIACTNSSELELTNSVISENTTEGFGAGGGIYIHESDSTIEGCTISGNRSSYGGGIYIGINSDSGATPLITHKNCIILGNYASSWGGGIYLTNTDAIFDNCTISNNLALEGGGAMNIFTYNNDIINNDALMLITNSIIYGNIDNGASSHSIRANLKSRLQLNYNNIAGITNLDMPHFFLAPDVLSNIINIENIDADPNFILNGSHPLFTSYDAMFVALQEPNAPLPSDYWVTGDYHLQSDSPSIDTGDPTDAAFNIEPINNGNRINQGAYGKTAQATASLVVLQDLVIKKSTIEAGKNRSKPKDDISISGSLYGDINDSTIEDLLASSGNVMVKIATLDNETIDEIILSDTCSFDISSPKKRRKAKEISYKRHKKSTVQAHPISELELDFKKNKFKLKAKNVDLTGLSLPLNITLSFGLYSGNGNITTAITNKGKGAPHVLLQNHTNTFTLDKYKFKFHEEKKSHKCTDTLYKGKGYITATGKITTATPLNFASGNMLHVVFDPNGQQLQYDIPFNLTEKDPLTLTVDKFKETERNTYKIKEYMPETDILIEDDEYKNYGPQITIKLNMDKGLYSITISRLKLTAFDVYTNDLFTLTTNVPTQGETVLQQATYNYSGKGVTAAKYLYLDDCTPNDQ